MSTDTDEGKNAIFASGEQVASIAAVNNSVLVFCGLLVAGTFTFVASSWFQASGFVAVLAVAAVFMSSFGACILALVAMMKAHNLARRTARLAAGIDTDPARQDAARKWAVGLSIAAFWATIAATVSAAGLLAWVLYWMTFVVDPLPSNINVEYSQGLPSVTIDGAPRTDFLMKETDAGCRLVVQSGKASISLNLSTQACPKT